MYDEVGIFLIPAYILEIFFLTVQAQVKSKDTHKPMGTRLFPIDTTTKFATYNVTLSDYLLSFGQNLINVLKIP